MTGTPAAGAQATPETYATFVGGIDQSSAYRLTHWLGIASQRPGAYVHLLFHSLGGTVGEGILLYEFFRAAPFEVTLYNSGSVSSIAAVAFLGARHRKVGRNATFMLHRTTFTSTMPAGVKEVRRRAETLAIDDQRMERILRQHLRLEADRWDDLDGNDVWFTADEAVAVGLADAVAEFAPPQGTQIWDFNLPVQGMTP
jgi:ATP-dependent Clp protease protease subunit